MIGVHWIPTHRGMEDVQRFARWQPPFIKIVCIDERPPYLEDVPTSTKIVIRNHPMSELYGSRGFVARGAAMANEENLTARYQAYFATFHSWATWSRKGYLTNDSFLIAANPEQVGAEHAAACERMAQYCEERDISASRLLFEGLNEPQLWAGEPPELTARYYRAFLQGLHGYGLHGVVGNFGVGWPGNGGINDAPVQWDFFKPVIDVMRSGDYLGLHEYWALNGPQQNWRWWAGRFLQCPWDVPILVTECGIDTGVTGAWYGGWYDLAGNSMDQKAARYVDEIWWYAEQCAADGRVQGIFPFTYDIGGSEWEKFDIRSEVWLSAFFEQLDTEGMPQPGENPMPDPIPTSTKYTIIGAIAGTESNAAMSYVDGYCRMMDGDGNVVKYMGGGTDPTKFVYVRWRGNPVEAEWIKVQVGSHPGYMDWTQGWFSIPLAPKDGNWDACGVDMSRGIQSAWVPFATSGTEVHMLFDWMPKDTTPPPPPDVTAEDLRNAAWNQLDVAYNPDAAFSLYARAHGLGNPVSNEFDLGQYRAQGFAGGIVYAVIGDWLNCKILPW